MTCFLKKNNNIIKFLSGLKDISCTVGLSLVLTMNKIFLLTLNLHTCIELLTISIKYLDLQNRTKLTGFLFPIFLVGKRSRLFIKV